MFLDCFNRPIGDADEFLVAIDNVICHGLAVDPVEYGEYDIKCRKNEDVLFIECFDLFAKKNEFPLIYVLYKCRKDKVKVLKDVMAFLDPDVTSIEPKEQ